MKGTFILWSVIIFYSSTVYSQWTNQNPVPEGNHLWSTFFVDYNNGWIVGTNGFIKKTTNAGLDWVQQNSGTTLTLKSLQFINQDIGWICGDEGLIIKTTDGGQSWFGQMSGTIERLTDLQFLDLNIGYIVGYNETILKTTDGGSNWVTQQSGSAYDLFSVDLVDALLGYAVGGRDSTKFLKTTDGGLNWLEKTFITGYGDSPKILNCVEFVDPNVGWIGTGTNHYTYGTITKTTDGGESWFSNVMNRPVTEIDSIKNDHQFDNFNDTQKGIRSIYFKDLNNGYAVGGTQDGWRRSIYTTTDAGATWQPKYRYSEQTGVLSVFVNSTGQGWAVGYHGVIYKTDNDGSSWSQILSGTQVGYAGDWITSVFMINDSDGWASGYRKGIWYYPIILRTTTGGKIWETNSEFDDSFFAIQSNIFFLNENIGWVSFTDVASYKTTDGGDNWFSSGNAGNQKFFINQDTGWATYEPLGIFKSTDGGSSWVRKSTISSNGIYFSDANNGWAVGSGGSILKSTDGGEIWISKTSGTTSDLNSVQFYNSNIGICVGSSGTVLISTDSGENWYPKNAGTTAKLNSVIFINATTAWIAGSSGTILNTADFGNSWISYNGATEFNLSSIYFTNENTGWVVGGNNIFKYQNNIVPVELLSFTAYIENNNVIINWQTATELNNAGFEIERRVNAKNWISLGFIEGYGNSTSLKSYSFIDENPMGGNNFIYRLKQIDNDGKYKYSDLVEVEITPDRFELSQNYPNPFNPSTKIRYLIPAVGTHYAVSVLMKVYDILGNEVATLVNENKEPGNYEVELNARGLASGTYIYKIAAGNFVESKKMLLLR